MNSLAAATISVIIFLARVSGVAGRIEGGRRNNLVAACSGYCQGNHGVWPFGCAQNLPNVVNYLCGPTEGCYYTSLVSDEGPAGFCVFKGPNVGGKAHPTTPEGACRGYCQGNNGIWPFGCALDLPNTVTYFCGPTDGCYYASSDDDEGPAGFCAYKGQDVTRSPVTKTFSPSLTPSPSGSAMPTKSPSPSNGTFPSLRPSTMPPAMIETVYPSSSEAPSISPQPTTPPSMPPSKIPTSAPSQEPSQFHIEFDGLMDAYSIEMGRIDLDWDTPTFLGPYSDTDVVYDIFMAVGHYNFSTGNGTTSSDEMISMEDLKVIFQEGGGLTHKSTTETRTSLTSDLLGELHSLLVIASIGGVSSMNRAAEEVVTSSVSPAIKENVTIVGALIADETLRIAFTSETTAIVFTGNLPAELLTLEDNDYITGVMTDGESFLRRVRAIYFTEESIDRILVAVENIALEDVFDTLDIDGTFRTRKGSKDGVLSSLNTRKLWDIDLLDYSFKEKTQLHDNLLLTTDGHIYVTLRVQVKIGLKWSLGFFPTPKLERASIGFIAGFSLGALLDFEKSQEWNAEFDPIDVWKGRLGKKTFWVGPIPVVVTYQPRVQLEAEATAMLSLSSSLGIRISSETSVFAGYEDGGTFKDFNPPSFDHDIITPTTEAELSVSAGINFNFFMESKVYGVLGASLDIKPGLEVNAKIEPAPPFLIGNGHPVELTAFDLHLFVGLFLTGRGWLDGLGSTELWGKSFPLLALPTFSIEKEQDHICSWWGGGKYGLIGLEVGEEQYDLPIQNQLISPQVWLVDLDESSRPNWKIRGDGTAKKVEVIEEGVTSSFPPSGTIYFLATPIFPPFPNTLVTSASLGGLFVQEEIPCPHVEVPSGCLAAMPKTREKCSCNTNPTVSVYAACNKDNNPVYFDDINDIPNGACIHLVNGEPRGTSLTTCSLDTDCVAPLKCQGGMCTDKNGKVEAERLVTSCVSPKHTDSNNVYAGCPFNDGSSILECHKYWISPKGMAWKRYVQHNPLGRGDTYAWAYDEAVCGRNDNHIRLDTEYPWCSNQHGQSGVDGAGNIVDSSCPCTVDNTIAPLNAVPFHEQGFGKHMYINVYDVMYPGYVPPASRNSFSPVDIPHVPSEDGDFYLKVVNQYEDEILVYMDVPPARKDEAVSGSGPAGAKWDGWTGPTQKLRGESQPASNRKSDTWVSRITIARNVSPLVVSQPRMRVNADGSKTGGFYVPRNHHLRIHLANEQSGGWYRTTAECPNAACFGPGTSLWMTRADSYTYADRDPLLLAEINVNAFTSKFADGTIWMDISAVDGVNSNFGLRYGRIDRVMSVPLFEAPPTM